MNRKERFADQNKEKFFYFNYYDVIIINDAYTERISYAHKNT